MKDSKKDPGNRVFFYAHTLNGRKHGLNLAFTYLKFMIEKQTINNTDVWIKVEPLHVKRDNPNIIPTEYFTAAYYLQQPAADATHGEMIREESGETKLFESPVAAVSFASDKLRGII